jgi:hypothetical protein
MWLPNQPAGHQPAAHEQDPAPKSAALPAGIPPLEGNAFLAEASPSAPVPPGQDDPKACPTASVVPWIQKAS